MSSTTTLSHGIKPSIGQRINFRMLTVVLVFAVLVGYPVFTFVKAQVNHGIDRQGNVYKVDLKALGNFGFDDTKGTIADVPANFRQLDGKQVALEGFMWNGRSSGAKVSNFEFVYNITKCCFSGPPRVQERVFALVPENAEVDFYSGEEVRIIGTLHVNVTKDDGGKISSVYAMDVQKVEPL